MRFGILGSGQLAWMLSLAAKKLGHEASFVSDPSKLQNFDFLTFESEFLDIAQWQESLSTQSVYPSLDIMHKLSDKWEQKQLFEKYQLPTAKAELYADEEIPQKKAVIAKWARQGYDGYGNLVINEKARERWPFFKRKAQQQNSRIYIEDLVPFEAECALVVARDKNSKFLKYPLFVTEQSNSVCNWVWGPATVIDTAMQSKLEALWPKLQSFLNDLNYVGVIAFEFFWAKGTLLLNEVAPRVHNSGHITLDAFNFSQFDLHLLAPLGFADIELKALAPRYAMKNFLGTENFELMEEAFREKLTAEKTFYWYGKKESRPGRKMAHLNVLYANKSREEMKTEIKKEEESLWQNLKRK